MTSNGSVFWLLQLVLLHRVDGQEVHINPKEVISVTAPKLVTGKANCVVSFTDARFISVLEPCGEVLRKIQEHKP